MKKFAYALRLLALLCALTANACAQVADAAPAMKFLHPSADADEQSDFAAVAARRNWQLGPPPDSATLMPDGARQTEIVYGPGLAVRTAGEHFNTAQQQDKEGGQIDEDGNIFRVIYAASPLYADGVDYLLFLGREKSRDNLYMAGGFSPVREGRVYLLDGRTENGIAPGTQIGDVGRDIATLASTPCRQR